jgi:hypothetical protein
VKGLLDVEIVVESVCNRRTEADARAGPEASHRRREDVRRRVAQHVERVLVAVVCGQKPDLTRPLNRPRKLDDFVIQLRRDRLRSNITVNSLRQLAGRDTGLDLYFGAVLELQRQHLHAHLS